MKSKMGSSTCICFPLSQFWTKSITKLPVTECHIKYSTTWSCDSPREFVWKMLHGNGWVSLYHPKRFYQTKRENLEKKEHGKKGRNKKVRMVEQQQYVNWPETCQLNEMQLMRAVLTNLHHGVPHKIIFKAFELKLKNWREINEQDTLPSILIFTLTRRQ